MSSSKSWTRATMRVSITGQGMVPHIVWSHRGRRLTQWYRSAPTAAKFDPSGKHVFVGTTLGTLLVFNTRTKTVCVRCNIQRPHLMQPSFSPDDSSTQDSGRGYNPGPRVRCVRKVRPGSLPGTTKICRLTCRPAQTNSDELLRSCSPTVQLAGVCTS